MAHPNPIPLTDHAGESRSATAEDFAWAVEDRDFSSLAEVHEFLSRREDILEAAEKAGIPRETFLAFAPNKPGFEDRVAEAFGAFFKDAGIAAE